VRSEDFASVSGRIHPAMGCMRASGFRVVGDARRSAGSSMAADNSPSRVNHPTDRIGIGVSYHEHCAIMGRCRRQTRPMRQGFDRRCVR
jgi:hypothetical protein